MSYFFIDGGGGWRNILSLIKKGDTIIGSNDSINTFFEKYMNVNVIKLRCSPSLITNKKYSSVPFNVIMSEIEYNRYFKDLENEDIYLFGRMTTIVFFKYLKKLSGKNRIHFLVPSYKKGGNDWFFAKKKRFYQHLLMRIFSWIYNVKVGFGKLHTAGVVWQISKNTVKNYDWVRYESNEKYGHSFDIETYGRKIVLLLNDFHRLHENHQSIIDFINETFDEKNVILKSHPRCGVRGLEKFKELPKDIPVEIIIGSNNFDAIVSIYICKTLISSNIKCKKISLYHLFDWRKPVQDIWFDKYKKSDVALPKTVEEFNKMV